MINLLLVILLIVLWVNGFYILIKDGMIFGFIGAWRDKYFDKEKEWSTYKYIFNYLLKPIIVCRPCMSSVHGFFVYSLSCIAFDNQFSIIALVLSMICSVPIVYLTTKIIK